MMCVPLFAFSFSVVSSRWANLRSFWMLYWMKRMRRRALVNGYRLEPWLFEGIQWSWSRLWNEYNCEGIKVRGAFSCCLLDEWRWSGCIILVGPIQCLPLTMRYFAFLFSYLDLTTLHTCEMITLETREGQGFSSLTSLVSSNSFFRHIYHGNLVFFPALSLDLLR